MDSYPSPAIPDGTTKMVDITSPLFEQLHDTSAPPLAEQIFHCPHAGQD
jgi:hypothetical protein